MEFDKALIAGKLRRWEKYIDTFRLPAWENIPDIGLYMEQVLSLLRDYFNYIPPELVEEELITPAAINNYVRKKIMPEPVKKAINFKYINYFSCFSVDFNGLPLCRAWNACICFCTTESRASRRIIFNLRTSIMY